MNWSTRGMPTPPKQINFRFHASNWGAVLRYTATTTATQQLPTISMTPRIWRQEPSGDVLVSTGAPTACSATDTCSISGDFIPVWDVTNVTGTFFANVTTVYTLPVSLTGVGQGNDKVATIYPTGSNEPVREVVVTGPLSPVEPGTMVTATNANNSVPWGGTIEHVMNGVVPTTIVYDSSGQSQSRADDREAEIFITPQGDGVPMTIDPFSSLLVFR